MAKHHNTKILYVVVEDLYFWLHRVDLARAVRDVGCDVIVATAPGNLQARIESEGFRYYPLRLRRKGLHPWHNFLGLLDLFSLYRLAKPDLVHHVTIKPVLYGSIAAKMAGVPAIVNLIPGLGYAFIAGNWRRWLLRQAVEHSYRLALAGETVRVIFQNTDDRNLFVTRGLVPAARARLIMGSGVDTTRFSPVPLPAGEPVILLVARMLWDKGIQTFVDAGRILRQRHVPGRLILAGMPDPANPSSVAEAQLLAWHEEGIVAWVGFQDDMPALLHQAHIVCLPTTYPEGIPRSLIEAASCGRPIVTTNTPGCREIAQDGWNGLLVPPNDPIALADALQRLLENPALCAEMGARGRELVLQRFTREIVIRETFAVYQDLLGSQWSAAGCAQTDNTAVFEQPEV